MENSSSTAGGEGSGDLPLVRDCLEGRPEAFRSLVESYQALVFDLCWRMLGNAQDVEDATQETFVRLYRHLPEYKAGHKLSNWLYTIALNLCRNRLRRRRLLGLFSLDRWLGGEEDERPAPEPPARDVPLERGLEAAEEAARLDALVGAMPETLRAPFVLRYFQELEDEAIAEVLGLNPGNVRVRLHRAKAWLRERLALAEDVTGKPPGGKEG